MKNGVRADVRLVECGMAATREKARSLIMAGAVYIDDRAVAKPGDIVAPDSCLTVRKDPNPYVSRGGLKLDKAICAFGIELNGVTALDIGASTGGFTDCMLHHGAAKVYALDVGYGQLDWSLRNDPRVVVMERVNARSMEPEWFESQPGFAGIDVSFISLRLILPALYPCIKDSGLVVALVKPQFEAGRDKVGKNGVVRDERVHCDVLTSLCSFAQQTGFLLCGMEYSPITGPKGNIEFLLFMQKTPIDGQKALSNLEGRAAEVEITVRNAHNALIKNQ